MRMMLNMHCINLLKRKALMGKNVGRQGREKNQTVQGKQHVFVLTMEQDATLIKDAS